jgi:hypothetical protein
MPDMETRPSITAAAGRAGDRVAAAAVLLAIGVAILVATLGGLPLHSQWTGGEPATGAQNREIPADDHSGIQMTGAVREMR